MDSWAADPELLATFSAEVDDRLTSLVDGLLQLEGHPAPRQLMGALFRDAHTVKGSARMLGLTSVLNIAHRVEDLLGAIRDGRLGRRRDLVDLLLASADALRRAIPGAAEPASDEELSQLQAALARALAGDDPVEAPKRAAARPAGKVDHRVVGSDAEPDAGSSTEQPVDKAVDRPLDRPVDSVRVTSRRVYDLLDVVGEAELDVRRVEKHAEALAALTADQHRLASSVRGLLGAGPGSGLDGAASVLASVDRLVATSEAMQVEGRLLRELADGARSRMAQVRDGAMGLAMVPVRRVFAALPLLVRDVAAETGKEVDLVLEGEDVELDKKVLDGVADALKHLVINAVDHGCGTAAERQAAGKSARATVTVSARSSGGTVVLDIADDGRGIDEDEVRAAAVSRGLLGEGVALTGAPLLRLLFLPAFSTSPVVTARSGRGVGLDVVHAAVEDLGGNVEVWSQKGVGTRFSLTLPITLGVLRCLLARVGEERYAIPLAAVVESVSLREVAVNTVAGAAVVARHGASVPLLDLGAALGTEGGRERRAAVVVRGTSSTDLLAWSVDRLDGELELVVKDLGTFVGRLPLVTGATIDGDGSVVCLVDLRELAERVTTSGAALAASPHPPARARSTSAGVRASPQAPSVLVVEDSLGVRELERVILENAGYKVITAVDGLDGAARLADDPPDLVLSDVEMPGMDGFTLTRTIRSTRGWEQVPVIIMTSRGDESDRRAGLDAGANAYLLKSDFDQRELVETVRRLVGR